MEQIRQVAVVHEDDKPIRAFVDDNCIYKAYVWCHKHFCLADEGYAVHKLPDWLKVTYHVMTTEQLNDLIK